MLLYLRYILYHTRRQTNQTPARKMLRQFAIILLATILGITGSANIIDDDNTPGKTLSPILYSKPLAILTQAELQGLNISSSQYFHKSTLGMYS